MFTVAIFQYLKYVHYFLMHFISILYQLRISRSVWEKTFSYFLSPFHRHLFTFYISPRELNVYSCNKGSTRSKCARNTTPLVFVYPPVTSSGFSRKHPRRKEKEKKAPVLFETSALTELLGREIKSAK